MGYHLFVYLFYYDDKKSCIVTFAFNILHHGLYFVLINILRNLIIYFVKFVLQKEAWTEEEDMKLIQAHEKMGNKWAEISKMLPGRSESDIKNRWNATKRKCINAIQKSKNTPKPSSLFENYVKTMFNNVGQSGSPTSGESSAMGGSSSGGSNSKQAGTDGSVSVEDYGVSTFEANVLANNSGPMSQFESMTYLDMLLQQ